jgi:hypothetical protein
MAEGRESTASKRREYRAYALQHQGDALRGQGVFKNESKAACIKCHSTDGKVAKHKGKAVNRFRRQLPSRAEGMGLEPTTPCGALHFQCSRWPIRLPSRGLRYVLS